MKEEIFEKIHRLSHEADYAIVQGDLPEARKLILEIDILTHNSIYQFKPSSEQPEKKWPTDEEIENAIKKHFRHDGIFVNGTDYECSDALDDMRKGAKWVIEFIKQYQSVGEKK